jgi:hypothetical protein
VTRALAAAAAIVGLTLASAPSVALGANAQTLGGLQLGPPDKPGDDGENGDGEAVNASPIALKPAPVVVSPRAESVAVVIYRARAVSTWRLTHGEGDPDGVALITETRTLDLPAGPAVIRFEGVSDRIAPQTASVEGLPAAVLERNFDYDLLSPGSLIAKSLGRTVRLIDTNLKTGKSTERRAILRSGPDGVMLETDGRFEAFQCSAVPQRLVFDRLPDGLSDRPTLSLRTEAGKPGRYTVKLSYLATGLNWSADYVARVRPDGKTLDLEGWITLANAGEVGFHDAPTQVVAGRLALTGDDRAVEVEALTRGDSCWPRRPPWGRVGPALADVLVPPPMAVSAPLMREDRAEIVVTGRKRATQEDLGDYKLYTLPEPTTVAARQTKQVLFLAQAAVPFRRVYRYVVAWPEDETPQAPTVILRLENTTAGGLGLPLPAGNVSVRGQGAAGTPLLIGEAPIRDTPKGLPVKLSLGPAHTVSVTQRVLDATFVAIPDPRVPSQAIVRTEHEITVANPLDQPATVEIVHPASGEPDFKLVSESRAHGLDAGDLVWTLTVPAGRRAVLRYREEALRTGPRSLWEKHRATAARP